jgi:hypothetical protein
MQTTTVFTPSQLQSKIGTVLNTVQQEGCVLINGRSRPEMVLMMKESHDLIMQTAIEQCEKIKQLTALIKARG